MKVLIAEDEPALLNSYVEVVASLGHECLEACDGLQALALARAEVPDVILTDHMMPGRTGAEVIAELGTDERLAAVPVVLVSAAQLPPEATRGAFRFLPKPVSLEALERAIEDALRDGTREPRPRPLRSPESTLREAMLSWVSHEIKSPLAAASLSTQLALRGLATNDDRAQLEQRLRAIRVQLDRMNELVSSILAAAQLEDGRLHLALEPIEVGPWLAGILGFWRELQPEHRFVLDDGDGVVVEGDRERLRQVMDNLISNAVKYGGEDRTVRLVVRRSPDRVRISVVDTGVGIAAEDQSRIFDRFHRLPGLGGRGHGLGLYIAAALARLHGGDIRVDSRPRAGSTFTLELPARRVAREGAPARGKD